MNIEEEIKSIIDDQYSGYNGRFNKRLKPIHDKIRQVAGDEKFLEYLKEMKSKYPRPVYKPIKQ